jgi:hypothetical protein
MLRGAVTMRRDDPNENRWEQQFDHLRKELRLESPKEEGKTFNGGPLRRFAGGRIVRPFWKNMTCDVLKLRSSQIVRSYL